MIAKRKIFITAGIIAAVGVGVWATFNSQRTELSASPSYLFSEDFKSNKVLVYGVGIGDAAEKIDPSTIEQGDLGQDDWVYTSTGVGYRLTSGHVVEIVLNNTATKRFGLVSEDEILIRFGKPDKTVTKPLVMLGREVGPQTSYFYIDRGLIVQSSPLGSPTIGEVVVTIIAK